MLSSNNITKELINIEYLQELDRKRIKAFRRACYKKDRFWCCEFHCDRHFATEQDKIEFDIYTKNIDTINQVFSEKSSQKNQG